ncbi:DUF2207 domain-containing protein [uncultured Cetobacterium sp.]|uniref:DUF2207 domain-containing protein n=1 Tax=uncultured Cetobacterium sp. TaxID=527638 RepID=UPI0026265618|nr:DUF2207 domain-containing protein [uncultured Cetobacterium sp.]
MLKWSFSLFFLICSLVFSMDSGYVIDNYKVNIGINDKNVYTVKESIKVDFLEPRRGIYRVIPEKFNGRHIKVSDIKINAKTYAKDEGDYIYLRLGDKDRYLTGIKNYIINYTYNMGYDRNSKYDEVYYNLVGNDWDTNIKKLEFSITLPKSFNTDKINFTSGYRGSVSTHGVKCWVEGNTIKGYTTRVLGPKESVTLALPLPEGYFNMTSVKIKIYAFTGLLFLLLLSVPLGAYLTYRKFKDSKKVIDTVEFYPPDNLTPTEVGYYIDGRTDAKDLTSLIFYWASKGYLEIHDIDKRFIIKKLKNELVTENEFEKYLFNSLFLYGDGESIDTDDLREVFYKHIEKAGEIFEVDLALDHRRLYTSKSIRCGNTVKTFVALPVMGAFLYINFVGIYSSSLLISVIGGTALSVIITMIIGGQIKEKTEYGNMILGRVRGFKRFLETTEKKKLEMLLKENPSYFYDILPYTIVLGVSDMWADKFKDLAVEPPTWYYSNSMSIFTLALFMGSFNNSFSALNDSMLSAPKAPTNFGGGGSSMGGGSSGGGAGGGGGGSW